MDDLNSSEIEVLQLDTADCGLACLVSIHAFYGRHTTVSDIRCLLSTDISGTSMFALAKAAQQLGYQAQGIRANKRFLDQMDTPIIAHIQYREYFHYVVIYTIGQGSVQIMDPSKGRLKRISLRVFLSQWTGHLLQITAPSTSESLSLIAPSNIAEHETIAMDSAYLKMGWESWLLIALFQMALLGLLVYASSSQSSALWICALAYLLVFELLVKEFQKPKLALLSRDELGWARSSFKRMIRIPMHFYDGLSAQDLINRLKDPSTYSNYQKLRFFELPLDMVLLASLSGVLLIQGHSQWLSVLFLLPVVNAFITFSGHFFRPHEKTASERLYQECLRRWSGGQVFKRQVHLKWTDILRLIRQVEEKMGGTDTRRKARVGSLVVRVLQFLSLLFFVSLFFVLDISQSFDLFQILVAFYFVWKLRKMASFLQYRSRFVKSRKRLQEMLNFRRVE